MGHLDGTGALMTATIATSHDEQPLWISGGDERLLGIVTRPTADARRLGLVMCSGGHWATTIGPNRFHVRLARHFARLGFHTLRFDYAGLGESTGASRPFRLDSPFSPDAVAVARWLVDNEVDDVVLLGSCFGARTALHAAADIPHLRGVALFPPPVRDFEHGERVASLPTSEFARRLFRRSTLRGLRDRRDRQRYLRTARRRLRRLGRRLRGAPAPAFQWVSNLFVDPLSAILDRGIPVLVIYGEDDDFRNDFERGGGPIRALVERAGGLTIDVVPGRTHGLGSVAVQDAVLSSLQCWLTGLAPHGKPEPT
jgi:pimeloyl-ACP methyl ester carboxylesterase